MVSMQWPIRGNSMTETEGEGYKMENVDNPRTNQQ